MGRKKLWDARILVSTTKEKVEELESVREEGEDTLDVIREGIDREIKRRKRKQS